MNKNKVTITICGGSYTIVTEDNPEYVEELGEIIDKEMKSIGNESSYLSQTQCAILVALDQTDACKKATASADNLRAQIKDYLEESSRYKMEVDVAHREIERLNRELSNLRTQLAEK